MYHRKRNLILKTLYSLLTVDMKVVIPMALFATFLNPFEDGDLLVLKLFEQSPFHSSTLFIQVLFYNPLT